MKLAFAPLLLLVLMCALLFSQGKKQNPADTAKCLATCEKKCTVALDTCRKAAKNETAFKSCQKSRELCGSICVNKACSTQ